MISFLYGVILLAASFFAIPKIFLLMLAKGKYKKSLLQKFGFGFPFVCKGNRPLVWAHSVSVGETKAVAALLKKIKNSGLQPIILTSSGTETGYAEAKKTLAFADYHVFLPFDFAWIMKCVVSKVQPDLVVICETDLWYNFLRFSKERGAHVVVVNGKISEKSSARFEKITFFTRRLFSYIDLFCIQSPHYLQRFEKLGTQKAKLYVTGNIKFDDDHRRCHEKDLGALRARLALTEGGQVVVLGSTHDPEEAGLLASLVPVWKEFPCLQVIVVPRHPERFGKVAALLSSLGLSFHQYSFDSLPRGAPQVILVDAMGLLRRCYQLASVAVVAGSFTEKVGGHNILEPLYYGVPVVFGPNMFSQPELLELVLDGKAGIQVENMKDVGRAVADLLRNNHKRDALIGAGTSLITECRGASERTYRAIERLFLGKCK